MATSNVRLRAHRAHGWHLGRVWEDLPVYVMSLPRSAERRLNITSVVREHSPHLEFVPAVDGLIAIPPEQVCALPVQMSL